MYRKVEVEYPALHRLVLSDCYDCEVKLSDLREHSSYLRYYSVRGRVVL